MAGSCGEVDVPSGFKNCGEYSAQLFDFQLHNEDPFRMGLFINQFIYTLYVSFCDTYANVYFKTSHCNVIYE